MTTTNYIETFRRSSFEGMLYDDQAYYPQEPDSAPKTELPWIVCPVLMIHGLHDKYLLSDTLNETWKWFERDLTLVTVPDTGRFVQQEAAKFVTKTMAKCDRWSLLPQIFPSLCLRMKRGLQMMELLSAGIRFETITS